MSNLSTNAARLHRTVRSSSERIDRAFLDSYAMSKWLPRYGFAGKVPHIEARPGRGHRMSFTSFSTGISHMSSREQTDLVPHEQIMYTVHSDDTSIFGEILVTISLKEVSCGTDLTVVQEGLLTVIPVENCYRGWQE